MVVSIVVQLRGRTRRRGARKPEPQECKLTTVVATPQTLNPIKTPTSTVGLSTSMAAEIVDDTMLRESEGFCGGGGLWRQQHPT